MGMSIFEIIGPVMVGPSSSHTAGMARIGMMANRIINENPREIHLELSPKLKTIYAGHKSDAALFAGTVGMHEDDPKIKDAVRIVNEMGIKTSVDFLPEGSYPENTAKITVITDDKKSYSVTGTSIGGGSIIISAVDDAPLNISPAALQIIVWSKKALCEEILRDLCGKFGKYELSFGLSSKGEYVYVVSFKNQITSEQAEKLNKCEDIIKFSEVRPVLSYGCTRENAPECTSLKAACDTAKAEGISLYEFALRYEMERSGFDKENITEKMHQYWLQMKKSVEEGKKENDLIYGLTGGRDAKKLRNAIKNGRTISGGLIPKAVADAIGVMEYNASMGCIVAAPTAGSSGIVPGCMTVLAKEYDIPDERIEKALFISAIIGVIMDGRGVSFSGSVGGCQAEIGVSAAIAAAGIASLFTDDSEVVAHAMALCLKNLLGLVCDPIAGPIEVPCIKRNAVGVANAFISADMALAGIRSFIPPDEVIDALLDVERRLPTELRSGTVGGLACTCTAKCLRKKLGQ